MKPTIGRIVIYKPTPLELDKMVRNNATPHPKLPAMVVAVNEKRATVDEKIVVVTTINLEVFIDGAANLNKQEIKEGEAYGEWSWPPRV